METKHKKWEQYHEENDNNYGNNRPEILEYEATLQRHRLKKVMR